MKIISLEKVENGYLIKVDDGRIYIAHNYLELGRKVESLFVYDNVMRKEGDHKKIKEK